MRIADLSRLAENAGISPEELGTISLVEFSARVARFTSGKWAADGCLKRVLALKQGHGSR
jgi:hypothetical protein